MAIDSGLVWLDIFAWNTPRDRPILARLSDGSELIVRWSPLKQHWTNEQGERVIPVEWRDD